MTLYILSPARYAHYRAEMTTARSIGEIWSGERKCLRGQVKTRARVTNVGHRGQYPGQSQDVRIRYLRHQLGNCSAFCPSSSISLALVARFPRNRAQNRIRESRVQMSPVSAAFRKLARAFWSASRATRMACEWQSSSCKRERWK